MRIADGVFKRLASSLVSALAVAALVPAFAEAASVTASKNCSLSPCTVVEAQFTLTRAQTIQWQATYTGTATQGHSFYLSTVASNLADIPLTTSGQGSGTKLLAAGTYFIGIRLALMGPGTYTVTFNPSLTAEPEPEVVSRSRSEVRITEAAAAGLALHLGAADDAHGERAAQELLAALGPTLQASHRDELRPFFAESDKLGQTHLRLRQHVDGLPVIGGELIVHLDTTTRALLSLEGRFLASRDLSTRASLTAQAAFERQLARQSAGAEVQDEPELVFVLGHEGDGRLAWAANIAYVDSAGADQLDRVFVDAHTGAELARHPLLQRALNREVWDAQNTTSEAGRVRVLVEGGSSTDGVAQNAFDFMGNSWNYFKVRHAWDSYDNAGSPLRATVHFGTNFNNAKWDASARRLIFGDGDGVAFGPFPNALDVVAHELTHGVTQATAGLVYANESGALNEAMSDIFAAATEARVRGISSNTWLVGEDVITPGRAGDALRSMSQPTTDGISSDYYPERYTGTDDSGGVHLNSGIANLAFFLATQGGVHPRGKTVTNVRALGLPATEQIFFRSLRFHMNSGETFAQATQHTAQAARELFGFNSVQARGICEAWGAVGVPGARAGECLTVGDGLAAPTSVSHTSESCRGLNTINWSSSPGAVRYEVWGSIQPDDFATAALFANKSGLSALINVPGTRYIRVKACDAVGCGPYSLDYVVATRIGGCL